jgi:NADPH:quinone reductase-like Zn-dependent oxidoreductase
MASRNGGPEVLELIESEIPEPAEDEVRVKVLAAGVALADIMWLSGKAPRSPKPPYIPGYDIVGIVDQLGSQVTSLTRGQGVAALLQYGGYTEYANLSVDKLVPVPEGLDKTEIVCLTLNYITAYQILTRVAKVTAGERVLVHGAAGGVGTAFLQLGAVMGLKMYGTASQPKHDLVKSLGGIPIDYKNEDFVERIHDLTGDGVDLVVDHIGGKHFRESLRTLRAGGHLVATSSLSALRGAGRPEVVLGFINLSLWDLLPNQKHASFYDIIAINNKNPNWYSKDLQILMNFLEDGEIKPVIAKQMFLSEARKALELLWVSKVQGKIVLAPSSQS